MWSLYGGSIFFGGGRRRKASKPKKKPKDNWFERLTVDQNKQLCKAAKLKYGGNKKDLINRLLEDEQTSKFACEIKYVGLNVDAIKSMCRERNLQVSGNKFDLVLRILHCDNDSTPAGMTLKRAATDVVTAVDAATGEVVEKHVPKKRKKAAPSASRIYTRVEKKIESVKQKKYQSHWGSKTHSTDVYGLIGDILNDDVVHSEQGYLTRDPRFAITLAKAACTSLTDNFHIIRRPGYDDFGGWSIIDSSLRTIADSTKAILTEEERGDFAGWIEDMYNVAEPYGLTMDHDLMRTVEFLRSNGEGKKSEEEEEEADDKKPAAVVPVKVAEGVVNGNNNLVKENVVNASIQL